MMISRKGMTISKMHPVETLTVFLYVKTPTYLSEILNVFASIAADVSGIVEGNNYRRLEYFTQKYT